MIAACQALGAAPHRLFFAAGALQAILAMLGWTAWLAAREAGLAIALPLPPAWLHGWLTMFGMLAFFITGFTLTTVPAWLGSPPVPRREWLPACLVMLGGLALAWLGLWLGAEVLAAGVVLHWAGWSLATLAVQRVIAHSRHPGKGHFYIAVAVIACGLCAEITFAAAALTATPAYNAIARSAGLWLFLLPTFLPISHRVIPLFTRMAVPGTPLYQPLWMLPLMTVACLAHFLLEVAGLARWLWLADLPLLAVALLLALRWQSWRHLRDPAVGMLHLSFAWLPLALALYVAQGLGAPLGQAPLHALVAGYFGSTVLAMSARIARVHAGRLPAWPPRLAAALLAYQAVPRLRMAAEVPDFAPFAAALQIAAGVVWIGCWLVWCREVLPLLVRSA